MFKFIMGVIIGVVICAYYPSVVPIVKYKFLEPGGARDSVVETLKEIR
jgi:hypothetical protein|tara:strand:+ start:97 stop:240 length:144 start_codon:yes stop_codon:yes gene_type:complete